MKNAKLGKVEMRSSMLPSARHNLSRDVHTTMSFCDFQPTMVHEMLADSTYTMNIETGVLMGSMVVPTMGRLNLESFGIFVPTTDVFDCYNEYKTGTPFAYGGDSFVPLHRPRVPLCLLSLWCLVGARMSLYNAITHSEDFSSTWDSLDANATREVYEKIRESYSLKPLYSVWNFDEFDGTQLRGLSAAYVLKSPALNVNTAWSNWFAENLVIPTAGVLPDVISPVLEPWYLLSKDCDNANSVVDYGTRWVSIEKPDFQINVPYKSDPSSDRWDSLACLCVKMSDFGKRIYKMLRGQGWKPNFNDPTSVDISPLMATWKAYYDMFGVKKWSNFQNTPLARMKSYWLSKSCPSTLVHDAKACELFRDFMYDLGRMWFTDEQDYISAHQANVEDDPTNPISMDGFIDVGESLGDIGSAAAVVQALGTSPAGEELTNYHAAITRVIHSQLDSELLQKWYLWTNRDSVIGMDVAELLRAQGHAKWIDEHQSRFIGHHVVKLNIDKVISQSDTYNEATDEGSLLGEYGGRGLGYDANSVMSYHANEHGFFIVLSVVVPKAGFCQGEDLRWRRDGRMQEYQPEFDGVGMEATPKSLIYGGDARTPLDNEDSVERYKWYNKTFGFIPMYSRYKYMQNLMNGEFEFNSTQREKLSYTLDRILTPNLLNVQKLLEDNVRRRYVLQNNGLSAVTTPIAGPLWRYLGRYGWLANFRRIFAVRGDAERDAGTGIREMNPYMLEFTVQGPDDFICHFVQNNQYNARMLPLSGSFETKKQGNDGKPDMASAKA